MEILFFFLLICLESQERRDSERLTKLSSFILCILLCTTTENYANEKETKLQLS